MGYPLVPGYESVGRVVDAGARRRDRHRTRRCSCRARNASATRSAACIGGAASLLVAPASRVVPVTPDARRERGAAGSGGDRAARAARLCAVEGVLIVGHGVLGRLLARLVMPAGGEPPVVWEANSLRRGEVRPATRSSSSDDDACKATTARSSMSAATPRFSTRSSQRLAPGRRDRARRILRSPELQLSAGFHARGAHPDRRATGATAISPGVVKLVEAGTLVARRPHDPSTARRRTRLPPTPSLSTTRPVSRWSWTGVQPHEPQRGISDRRGTRRPPRPSAARRSSNRAGSGSDQGDKGQPRSSRSTARAASARVSPSPICPT